MDQLGGDSGKEYLFLFSFSRQSSYYTLVLHVILVIRLRRLKIRKVGGDCLKRYPLVILILWEPSIKYAVIFVVAVV